MLNHALDTTRIKNELHNNNNNRQQQQAVARVHLNNITTTTKVKKPYFISYLFDLKILYKKILKFALCLQSMFNFRVSLKASIYYVWLVITYYSTDEHNEAHKRDEVVQSRSQLSRLTVWSC